MTEYIFRLSDETPKIEIDVKAAAIINGVGQDLYDRAKKELGFTGTFEEFLAKFKGERGERGVDGKSVYELALENGFTGDLDQWLKSLRGLDGLAGKNGADGKSAYELAGGDDRFMLDGVDGFLKSLIGATGAEGDTGPRGADGLPGAKGDTGERGQDGKSAYEIAVANGYVGDEEQWLASLKGRDGERGQDGRDGESAFEAAGGELWFGTKEKWLASLKGAKGDTGAAGKSATVTIGTVTTGETASVTNTGTGTDAVLNFVLPAGGGGNNGLHTEIRTIPVTVNAQQIQTVEFEAKFSETPTLHGQPALMGAGENHFLYLLSVDKNGFTCRSNYFSAGIQTIHYAVTGKLS